MATQLVYFWLFYPVDLLEAPRSDLVVEVAGFEGIEGAASFPRELRLAIHQDDRILPDSIGVNILINNRPEPMTPVAPRTWRYSLAPDAGRCELLVSFVLRYRLRRLLDPGHEQLEPLIGSHSLPVFGPAAEIRTAPTLGQLCTGRSAPLKATVHDHAGCPIRGAQVEWRWESQRGGSVQIQEHPVDADAITLTALTPGIVQLIATSGEATTTLPIEVADIGPECSTATRASRPSGSSR